MNWKTWMGRGALVAGMVTVLGPAAVEAQSVEAVLRARERLELTEQQVQQLDEIRRAGVQTRAAEMARMSELRSQLEAGQIRRSDVMAAMEDQQEARRARAEELRTSVSSLLTEAQRESLQQIRQRGPRERAGVGPRAGMRRAPGAGFVPGRGPGFERGPRFQRGSGFGPGPRARFRDGPRPGDSIPGPR